MKLMAKELAYSSIVGGGVMLLDTKGVVQFMIPIRGSTRGITREQSEAISAKLVTIINEAGLEVPDTVEGD